MSAPSLLEFVTALVHDPSLAAAYSANPEQVLHEANLPDVSPDDIGALLPVAGSMPTATSTDGDAAAIWRSSDVAQAFSLLDEPVMSESDPAESFAGEHVTGDWGAGSTDGGGFGEIPTEFSEFVAPVDYQPNEQQSWTPSSDILEADITGTETHTLDPAFPDHTPDPAFADHAPLSVAIDPAFGQTGLEHVHEQLPDEHLMGGD